MGLLRWFRRTGQLRSQTKSESTIRRVVATYRLATMEIEPGLWSVTAERQDTYQVSLFLWARDAMIHFMTSCEISVERDLIPRELTLLLLEENHRCEDGSFRLVPREGNRLVVLGRTIDTRNFPEADMKHLGEVLIERMQRMVCRLYAMGLIISGPEPREKQTKNR